MKKERKFLNFVLAIFVPRKMVRFSKMPFMLSLLLTMVAALLNILTSNIRAKKDVEITMGLPVAAEEIPLTFMPTNEAGENLPHISVDYYSKKEVNMIVNGEVVTQEVKGNALSADQDGIYHGTYVDEGSGRCVDVTIVIASGVYSTYGSISQPVYLEDFDLEGYLKQKRLDNTDYILYVFCMDNLYYLYNLEQDENGKSTKAASNALVYETGKKSKLVYYLPASNAELKVNDYGNLDTTLWTRVVDADSTIDFTLDEQFANFETELKPATRHLKNLYNALYGGAFTYSNLSEYDVDFDLFNSSFSSFHKVLYPAMVNVDTDTLKTMCLLISGLVTLLFPLIISLITWLISKSFRMKRFKNYYAICSLCFINTSLIAIILGIWLSYSSFAFYILLFAAIYFIVATLLINTEKVDEEENIEEEEKKTVVYHKIENDSSQIG